MKRINKTFVKNNLPKRPENSNKGSFGKIFSLCGSANMMGAAVLAAKAALSGGAGYVAAAVPYEEKEVLFASVPEAVALPLNAGRETAQIKKYISKTKYTLVLAGPGLGVKRAKKFLPVLQKINLPLVLDGDALNAPARKNFKFKTPVILTPHPLEAARLLNLKSAPRDRKKAAADIAAKYNCVCVLKGKGTIITDGKTFLQNTTGGSALAKAGTGDVLAGLISALWAQTGAQQKNALSAAACGVYIHGLCGELAGKKFSDYSVLASDLHKFIGRAIKIISNAKPT
ncbi:MAG: NAD(P)H-hydrate dehydratase [Elusimicrobium sp.]|jgi:NAD(P)H-hydrate epimerase|nr:NAD(P)H-hydrate dehydratase [Elusimicrobium sp.]